MENGQDVNTADSFNMRTPIFTALRLGRPDVVSFLRIEGARVDVEDRYGVSPLTYACCSFTPGMDEPDDLNQKCKAIEALLQQKGFKNNVDVKFSTT